MIVCDDIQGSPGWHALRRGILTASRAGELVTPAKLTLSTSRHRLLAKLLHEWLTGTSAEGFGGSAWTEHGHATEGAAGDWFTSVTGLEAVPVGFVFRDEERLCGCSPDLWVPDEAGVELKCPAGWTHIEWLREGVLPREHVLQVQFSLYVTGLPVWYWMSYGASPAGDGFLEQWRPGAYMPPLLVECEPEARYQDAFAEHVPAFLVDLVESRQWLIEMGARL